MAIKLVGGLEKERRGVYAGAVGRFDWSNDSLDTAIAIRTMTYKDGMVYLQAGKLYNLSSYWGEKILMYRRRYRV